MNRSDIMEFLRDVKKSTISIVDQKKLDNLFALINENLGFSLFEAIERGKREVCQQEHGEIVFEQDDICIQENFTYSEFLEITDDKLQSIFSTLDEVVEMAQLKPGNIDSICCTGGTSLVPAVRAQLIQRFGNEKIMGFNNFHSVIDGLAERALQLNT